jgi:hypothetical protein
LALAIAAIFRPGAQLIAEHFYLRQQLLVLQRHHPRPRLINADRRFRILASRWFDGWRNSLLIVKPETVLSWHRNSARRSDAPSDSGLGSAANRGMPRLGPGVTAIFDS